jgi:hypothetical protein
LVYYPARLDWHTLAHQNDPSREDIEIQTVPMRERITNEVRRFKKFEQMLIGTKTAVAVKDIDIRNYAIFILIEGTTDEKREFLRCLKSEIILSNKIVSLQQ